jgi:hypothetical protein
LELFNAHLVAVGPNVGVGTIEDALDAIGRNFMSINAREDLIADIQRRKPFQQSIMEHTRNFQEQVRLITLLPPGMDDAIPESEQITYYKRTMPHKWNESLIKSGQRFKT